MYSEPNRAFSYAVLASIVLHGMLLFGVSQRERATPSEPQVPIVARLMEEQPPAPEPKPPAAAPMAIPPAVDVPPEARKPRPRPKAEVRKPVGQPAPVPQPEVPAIVEAPPAVEPAAPAPAPAPPTIARADPAPPAAPPAVAQSVPDEGTLAQYRLQLLSAARKYKRYPRVAMDNNWEGDVVVRMAVGANGALSGLSIRSSSGYAVLDQQALEMFRKAATTVQVPPALRGREFTFEVRAIYNLTEQNSG